VGDVGGNPLRNIFMKIGKPGLYPDMPVDDYFADPCPMPSFTQSLAKLLLEKSPLHAWHAHPRLNPDFRPDDDTSYDVGNIAHGLMIGRGKEIIVLDDRFEDWRTKEARKLREEAAAEGKLAVLSRKFTLAAKMVDAARDALEAAGCPDAFDDRGYGEAVIAWQEDGIWFRSMIDCLIPIYTLCYDYKTTGLSVAPHAVGRLMADAGWDIQAAMQERGLLNLRLTSPSWHFRFVAQEDKKPFATTVVELSESVMTIGRKKLDMAIRIWKNCMETNRFPGYPAQIIWPDYPGYAEAQWLNREETEAAELVMAG